MDENAWVYPKTASLRFGSGNKLDRVVVDLTRAQVKAAPEYKDGKPVVVLGEDGEVVDHLGGP